MHCADHSLCQPLPTEDGLLVGPELLVPHTEPLTALLKSRINRCLCQPGDTGPLKSALTLTPRFCNSYLPPPQRTTTCDAFILRGRIKTVWLILSMNKFSSRRSQHIPFRKLFEASRANVLPGTVNPENSPFAVQNKTPHFWRGSLWQRSIRKTYLHAAPSEVQPGLCLPACFREIIEHRYKSPEMSTQRQRCLQTASYGNALGCSLCTNSACNENTAIDLDLSENKSVLSVHFVL